MPPNKECPRCGMMVPDRHFEWHTIEEQREIVARQAAMECPLYKAGVCYDLFDLLPAPQHLAHARRVVTRVALWPRTITGRRSKSN
jgi:hypothetical protein